MPRRPQTTREDMIGAAFRLIREKGHEALTARNLAAELGCSTQPVMYQFPNMDTLRDAVYERADSFHSEYITSGADLLEMGLRYISFAQEEPMLFRFLFQSDHFSGLSIQDLIRAPETAGVLSAVVTEQGITREQAFAFFEPLAALVHGYASLIANNAMKYDREAIRDSLVMIAEGLERNI